MSYPEHMLKFWNEQNITPPKEMVVCAANKLPDGTVICGARHWDSIMNDVADKLNVSSRARAEEGFINQWGIFLSRKEALEIVKKNNQRFDEERNGCTDELYSEGLY